MLASSLFERWLAWRNRQLADPRFQRWAAAFPLTRLIAQRKARAVFDLSAGFVYSQVLHACVQLDLFERLRSGPLTLTELAAVARLARPAMQRLLDAAASLRLVQPLRGERYALGERGAALLGNPGAIAMVQHHPLLYRDLQDPLALLRGEVQTQLSRYWPYATASAPNRLDEAAVQGYTALMAASQSLVAEDILEAYPLARHHCLLDVGGGNGSFLAAAARAAPPVLQLMLFDLPAVTRQAQGRLFDAGLASRVSVHSGSFFSDPLPTGADVISLVRVVHDHDDERVLQLLAQVHAALPPKGTLLIAEPMAQAAGAAPMGAAYFGFYLLAMGSGRARQPAELRALLQRAGFVDCRFLRTRRPLLTGVAVCRRGPAPAPAAVSKSRPESSVNFT
jgi:demethylspheroidene O-methyltransferase